VLVKQKFLRKQYKDPMTQGRQVAPAQARRRARAGNAGAPAPPGAGVVTTTTTTTRPSAFSSPSVALGSGFQGVATTNTDKSLRVFNGRTKYQRVAVRGGASRA
jgi:hypothetical protein